MVIAAIDYPLQRFQRDKRLKMSLQDLRDENKQSEGSRRNEIRPPPAAGAIWRAAGWPRRMKDAQFVGIVNMGGPLHFRAVALSL